jgi:hypothetical protein
MAYQEVLTKALTPKQKVFIGEYLRNGGNGTNAAIMAGVPAKQASSMASQWLHDARYWYVQDFLKKQQYERNLRAKKSADDILEYLQVAMYFVPSRYFQPGDRGGWLIDEKNYKELPEEIGRIIEEVEVRSKEVKRPDGTEATYTRFWVKFISKTKVAQMVAKFMLGTKLLVKPDDSWFDQMMQRSKVSDADQIEGQIQQRLSLPAPGGNGTNGEQHDHDPGSTGQQGGRPRE